MGGRRRFLGGIWVGLLLLQGVASPLAWAGLQVRIGQHFPDLEFEGLLDPDDYGKLGLSSVASPVRLSEIPGDLLLLEFFNKSCVPCQRQVRTLQTYYEELVGSGRAATVRVLAVAVGNQAKYLGSYREKRGLTYPIAADAQFDAWRQIGDPGRTPFTVILVKRGAGWVLASFYLGVQIEEEFRLHVDKFLGGAEVTAVEEGGANPVEAFRTPQLPLARQEELARNLLVRITGQPVAVEAVHLADGSHVFRGRVPGQETVLFVRAAYRESVCEVCHPLTFVYAFDDSGLVRGYDSIQVTKIDNLDWDDQDNRFIDERLRDRPMVGLSFDPEVDAVAAATMSSAIIFDEIRRSQVLLEQLRGL